MPLRCRIDDAGYGAPTLIRAAALAIFAAAGGGVAWAAEASLGDATWSVSTGMGACLAAAVYEVRMTDSVGYMLGATLSFVCHVM